MGTLKKATVIIVIIYGFSLQLVAPDYNFLVGSPYTNAIGQRTKLTMVSFIIATCTEVGIFPDPANESNFYVCLDDATSGFLKYDFSCPPLEYFDSVNIQCIPSAVTATTTVTPSTTVSTTTLAPLQCLFEGIFPMPGNCKMYYRCSSTLKMFYFTCPDTSYFNELILKCSLIITPACQKQILNNSTTTVSATLTPTPLTSTTTSLSSTTPLAPSTTTLETTTEPLSATPTSMKNIITTSSTTINTPFLCTTSGTFPDPTNCKSYFRCSTKNVAFQYFCPGLSYFNEFTKKCGLTITPRCQLPL